MTRIAAACGLWIAACAAPATMTAPPIAASAPTTASSPMPAHGCASRHIHGVVRDRTSKLPIDHIQLSLVGDGDDGQDDATTDGSGHYDLRATTPTRERVVLFYADGTLERQLRADRCDEVIDWEVGLQASSPGLM